MENKGISIAITSFILILIGLILLQTLSGQVYSVKTLDTIRNDSFTATNTTCTQVTTGCIDSLKQVTNTTIDINVKNFTICTSSTGNKDGLTLKAFESATGTAYEGATLNATYTYSPNCMYITDDTSKTLVDVVILLFVLAVLAGGIWGLYAMGWFGGI